LKVIIKLSSLITLLLILTSCASGKQSGKVIIPSPYTFTYKTNKKNVKFFTQGDTYNTLKAASPFYNGAQPLPTKKSFIFYKLRAAKVAQIKKEADVLVKRTKVSSPKVRKIRAAYLRFLTTAYKEEPKLKDYTKETFSRIALSRTKEALVAAEYDSLQAKNKNEFANSYIDYLRVSKAVELGALYLEDIQNIVGFSAIAINSLAKHQNKKIKNACAKLDKEMAEFDNLRGDINGIQNSMAKIDYGQRQLVSSDYYLAKEGLRFMSVNLPAVRAKAKQLRSRPGLSNEDIAFIKNYVQVMSNMDHNLTVGLKDVDRKRLLPVQIKKHRAALLELVSPAFAADELPFVSGAASVLRLPLRKGKKRPNVSRWDILKVPGKVFKGLKTTTGVILDTAGVAVKNITRAGYGIYYGESAKSIWRTMQKNTKIITNNYKKGISGATILNTSGNYLEGVETGAGQAAEKGAQSVVGKGWTSWGIGGFTKLVVGTFTGLGKGIYKIANTKSTTADMVHGSVDVGLAFIGGSKTIFNSGVRKTVGREAVLAAKGGFNFLRTILVNADKRALKKTMAALLSKSSLTKAEVGKLIATSVEYEAKEAVERALAASRGRLLKAIKNMLKAGGRKSLAEGKKGLQDSLEGLLRKTYSANLAGLRDLLGNKVGTDMTSFLGNFIAGQADNFISDLITEVMAGPPEPNELNGSWKGVGTVTDVVLPPGAKNQKPEGCDLNADLSKIKGKSQPLNWNIQMGDDGNGKIETEDDQIAIHYNNGAVSGSGNAKGAKYTLSGEFKRGKKSGYTGAGKIIINSTTGIKFILSWTVGK